MGGGRPLISAFTLNLNQLAQTASILKAAHRTGSAQNWRKGRMKLALSNTGNWI
jgi:hypothetical protein